MLNLDENINKYLELQTKQKELKKQLDDLKLEIVNQMNGEKKHLTASGVSATISESQSFDYSDEIAVISYLKSHKMNQYVVETVNTTELNKALKESKVLNESMSSLFTVKTVTKLAVK